jgi:hypothetical protein
MAADVKGARAKTAPRIRRGVAMEEAGRGRVAASLMES